MHASAAAVPIAQGSRLVLDEMDTRAGRRYVRANQEMSKLVYRAQVIRDVFGARAARLFMRLTRVDTTVAQRVLRSPLSRLRR